MSQDQQTAELAIDHLQLFAPDEKIVEKCLDEFLKEGKRAVGIFNDDGCTPIQHAIREGNEGVLEVMARDKYADPYNLFDIDEPCKNPAETTDNRYPTKATNSAMCMAIYKHLKNLEDASQDSKQSYRICDLVLKIYANPVQIDHEDNPKNFITKLKKHISFRRECMEYVVHALGIDLAVKKDDKKRGTFFASENEDVTDPKSWPFYMEHHCKLMSLLLTWGEKVLSARLHTLDLVEKSLSAGISRSSSSLKSPSIAERYRHRYPRVDSENNASIE